MEEVKANEDTKTEETSKAEEQAHESSSSSDEKSPVIARTKPIDLNSTLDNESQKVEIESQKTESAEDRQNEDIAEGPELGENKSDAETHEDGIKETEVGEVETEDSIENIKNEAIKQMDENENGTPPRKKQKVEDEKIENRQIEQNSSDEEPEEVNKS